MASLQRKGLQARVLSSEEEEKLKRDQALVSDFKQQKLEKEAQKNWDLFYKRNSTNFFKDRHWTTREFEELRSCREFEDQKLTMLEAGCGVGNCLFPLLEEDPNIFAYACDFSPRAVEYVKQNPLYDTERCKAFQCDLTKDDLLEHVPPESVDVVTLIFVLSAVHPDKMRLVLQNIYKVLKPGKSVLFRDYGLYDHAMLRFKAGSKLAENFYVRQDGTRSYFFTDEQKQPLPWSLEVLLSLKMLWLSLLPLPAAQLCSGVQAASTVICLPSRIPGATLSGYRLRRTGERVRVSCNSE
ncbi:methyltransferase-like protein 6 isoform X1 [Sus scrofa]|uniref:tRNA N(3)-cytidine methyltransferase METTL6 isoform 1 n=1 Tax=Sus scrofa TaxID=9823 RepID=UPI000207D9E5|nr:tRNA N(3)-methylcytidine methyltransferase METTL6 isoform 1 [Sus scrofa]XP_020924092.1 methyltransferase-like protein 6 isoform X1 [Sus scrofa]